MKDSLVGREQGGRVLFAGMSHERGRNARVTVYRDRIERVKARSRTSVTRAAQDVEFTPIQTISSVQARKDGLRTNVTVYASGNNIEFRFEHREAAKFRKVLSSLIATGSTAGHHVPPEPAVVHVPAAPQAPTGTPPGWYPDPTGRHGQRWWGGVTWMDAVLDGHVQSTDAEGVRLMDALPETGPTLAEQLRELAELRDQGILTEDEFLAQKAKLLE